MDDPSVTEKAIFDLQQSMYSQNYEDLPEAIRQLDSCLQKSNENIIQLKDSLRLVLRREDALQREYEVLESRHNFLMSMCKGKQNHLTCFFSNKLNELQQKLKEAESASVKQEKLIKEQEQETLRNAGIQKNQLEKENARLRNELEAKQDAFILLQTETDTWKERTGRSKAELADQRQQNEETKSALNAEKIKNTQLQEDLKQITSRYAQKQKKSKEATEEKKQAESEWRALTSQFKAQLMAAEKEKYELEDQVWILKRDAENNLKKTNVFEEEIQELRAFKQKHTKERERVYKQLENIQLDLEQREKSFKESKDKREKQVRELESQIAIAQGNANEMQKMLEQSIEKLDRKETQYDSLASELQKEREKNQNNIDKMQYYRQIENEYSEMSANYPKVVKKLEDTETQLLEATEEITGLQESLAELNSSHQAEKEKKSAIEDEFSRFKSEFLNFELSSKKVYSEIMLWKSGLLEISCFNATDRSSVEDAIRSLLGVAPERMRGYDLDTKERVDTTVEKIKDILGTQIKDPSVHRVQELLNSMTEKYRQEMAERRRLNAMLQDLRGNIRVMCRVRPLLAKERSNPETTTISDTCQLKVSNPGTRRDAWFEFDRVFNPLDSQEVIYYEASDIVCSVMNGFNACIMAYGQTGSGKTHTMEGTHRSLGINYRAVKEIFEIVESRSNSQSFNISLSMIEVYNESIRDLLRSSSKKLEIREDNRGNTRLTGAEIRRVFTFEEILSAIETGKTNRSVGCTNVNEYSSRSHSIITLYVHSTSADGKEFNSKLNLIDLAGSERVSKSEAEGIRMQEACNINQSLSSLGSVLYRLASKEKHIPYRDSKLTHLLKDSLNGDAKTLMIVTVSPSQYDVGETISSLNFGARVASVEKGRAKINVKKGGRKRADSISEIESCIDTSYPTSPPVRNTKPV